MANERLWTKERITYFWNKIKSLVSTTASGKVDKVDGKGLSTNDYTNNDKTAVQTTLPNRITAIEKAKGANGGYAELDNTGKVPSSQLPSFVDDVLEYASLGNFPLTGESGKIYVALDTNKIYRWSGSAYVEISSSLALGETSATAYRGDRGKAAYDAAVVNPDSAPTENSTNLIQSGAVHTALAGKLDANQGSANAGKYMKVGNDGTLTPETLDIGSKADKDTDAVVGNFAMFDANGNPVDSGHKHGDYLTQHQDISGKADKVQNATTNNFAGLDANGNMKDSGKAASDFVAANQGAGNAWKTLGIDNTGAVVPVPIVNNLTTDDTTKALSAAMGKELNSKLASVENGLAYRETGTTASRNISDGKYVFWNGAMYKANGNIASGTTLVSGTNLTPTENALNALNSKLKYKLVVEGGNSVSWIHYYKNIYLVINTGSLNGGKTALAAYITARVFDNIAKITLGESGTSITFTQNGNTVTATASNSSASNIYVYAMN